MNDIALAKQPPLDEVMLAMDVVDTLRHRQRVVERALATDMQDAQLVARLREIYAGQGIEVSDAIIEQGVRDLRENRFVYSPSPPSLGRKLAEIYATRNNWSKPVALFAGLIAIALIGYQTLVRGPELAAIAALPEQLQTAYTAVVDLAEPPDIDAQALALFNDGELALTSENYRGVREKIGELDALRAAVAQNYEIRVRSSPGELSGVWRIPDANPEAQNFYLIVEAIDPDGNRLTLPIVNEEDGRTSNVRRWGQRVTESAFQAVANDKSDDGIIQQAQLGVKRRGVLDPEFREGVLEGAITDW